MIFLITVFIIDIVRNAELKSEGTDVAFTIHISTSSGLFLYLV
jgi:hypothetical protein